MKKQFSKALILVLVFLLTFLFGVSSSALSVTDDAEDFLGRKSILLTVGIEDRDYFADEKNLISVIDENTLLSGILCIRNTDVIFGATDRPNLQDAIILIDLTIYGTKNIETIKSALSACNGVKSAETDGDVQIDNNTGLLPDDWAEIRFHLGDTIFSRPGDVNTDGSVTAEDARLALRAAVGLDTLDTYQHNALLFNGKQTIDSAAARSVLRCSLGMENLHYNECTVNDLQQVVFGPFASGSGTPYEWTCTVQSENDVQAEEKRIVTSNVPGALIKQHFVLSDPENGEYTLTFEYKSVFDPTDILETYTVKLTVVESVV